MDQGKKALSRLVGGILCLFGAFVLSIVLACTSPIGNGGKELEMIAAALGLDTLHPELDRIADSIQPKTTDLDLIAEALGLEERVSHSGKELDSISQAVLGTPTVPAPSNDPEGTAQPQPIASPPVSQPESEPSQERVDEPDPEPENDTCRSAEDIRFTARYRTNVGASIDDEVPRCNDERVRGPGVWFKIEGASNSRTVYTANTCDEDTDFDTIISVYRGTCSNLECVTANDNHGGACDTDRDHSSVTWNTEEDETYYILVHGKRDDDIGDFRIDIDSSRPPENPPEPAPQPTPSRPSSPSSPSRPSSPSFPSRPSSPSFPQPLPPYGIPAIPVLPVSSCACHAQLICELKPCFRDGWCDCVHCPPDVYARECT